jgi:sigma-70-like protein
MVLFNEDDARTLLIMSLTPIEEYVFAYRYGLGDPALSIKDIGKRLNLTRAQVDYRLKKANTKLLSWNGGGRYRQQEAAQAAREEQARREKEDPRCILLDLYPPAFLPIYGWGLMREFPHLKTMGDLADLSPSQLLQAGLSRKCVLAVACLLSEHGVAYPFDMPRMPVKRESILDAWQNAFL